VLVPLRNVTVPVAPDGETVAVKIRDWPETEGLALELSVVAVLAFTVCVRVAEEAP
jgi:hypothetical protein